MSTAIDDQFTIATRTWAHRCAWRLWRGPIPEGKLVLHHCDNPRCINPDHLYLGTDADNVRDREARGRGGRRRKRAREAMASA